MIKREWIKRWDKLPDDFDEMIQSWDLSFGTTESYSSFVVGSVYGKKGANIYLLDRARGRWTFPETVAQIRAMAAKWPTPAKLIEKKANGQPVIDTLKNEIYGIIPVIPDGSKESRLSSVLPLYEAGNVFYPPIDKAPWIDDHIIEVTSFPHAKHDDALDAETQALSHFRGRARGVLTKEMGRLRPSGLGIQSSGW